MVVVHTELCDVLHDVHRYQPAVRTFLRVRNPCSSPRHPRLVLVHRVNGKAMEKYYIIIVTLLSIVLTVPAFGLNQFGCAINRLFLSDLFMSHRWDEANSTCWFKNPDEPTKLQWLIGTQSFWIALAATIETLCSGTVLIWMARFQVHSFSF